MDDIVGSLIEAEKTYNIINIVAPHEFCVFITLDNQITYELNPEQEKDYLHRRWGCSKEEIDEIYS